MESLQIWGRIGLHYNEDFLTLII